MAHAVYLDRFGNVQLDAGERGHARVGTRRAEVAVSLRGESWPAVYGRTFADVRRAVSCSSTRTHTGRLAVAVNQGSAVGRLGISVGDELRIAPA